MSEVEQMIDQKQEKVKNVNKLINFCNGQFLKTVKLRSDTSRVFALVQMNHKYEAIELSSNDAREWIKLSYYQKHGEVFSDDTYKDALDMMRIDAKRDASVPLDDVYKRCAQTNDAIWYDLCNQGTDLVKLDKEGIHFEELSPDTPIFFRTRRLAPQVRPEFSKDDSLTELCDLLKIPKHEQGLFKIHLISFFLEGYPMPIMAIQGEQGSIKSTITSTVKMLVDPSGNRPKDNVTSLSEDDDDRVISLYSNYVTAFDNVTHIDRNTSDDLCRSITGQTYAKRKLYTDMDEILMAYQSKVIMNGISINIDQYGDLLERTIIYNVPPVPEESKIGLDEYERRLDELLPITLGQCLDILQKAFVLYPKLKHGKLLRMSDFTKWGEAISIAMGNEPGKFFEMFKERQVESSNNASDSYAIVSYIKHLDANQKIPYKEKATYFYNDLKSYALEQGYDVNSTYTNFPRHPNKLRAHINRVNPFIRTAGYALSIFRNTERDVGHGNTLVYITKIDTQSTIGSFLSGEHSGEDGEHPQKGSSPVEYINFIRNGEDGEDGEHHSYSWGKKEKKEEEGKGERVGEGCSPCSPCSPVPKIGTKMASQVVSIQNRGSSPPSPLSSPLLDYKCIQCGTNTTYKYREYDMPKLEMEHQKEYGKDHKFIPF